MTTINEPKIIKKESDHPMNTPNRTQITIETLPDLFVGYYRANSATPELDSTEYLRRWLAKQNLLNPSVRIFGFDVDIPRVDSLAGKRGYETWMTIPADTQPSNGVKVNNFSGGLYATLILIKPFDDPFERIPNGWKFLHEWVINNEQYQGGSHQWLEELLEQEEGNDLKLYHPVTLKINPA